MTLEQVEIRGTVYNYIKDERVCTATGLIIPIDKEARDKLLEFTGFVRDMLGPLFKDETIKKVVALSSTTKGMLKKTGFFFINSNGETEITLTNESEFVDYLGKRLEEKGIPCELVNTLEFLKSESEKDVPNEEYFKILNNYYNPQSVDDTGIYIDGEMVEYGATVRIKNLKGLVAQYKNLKEGTYGVPYAGQVIFTINEDGVHSMNLIGKGIVQTEEGKNLTQLEEWYRTDFEGSHEKTIEQCKVSLLNEYAFKINDLLKSKNASNIESVNKKIYRHLKQYEEELIEYAEPLDVLVNMSILETSIKNGDAEIVK